MYDTFERHKYQFSFTQDFANTFQLNVKRYDHDSDSTVDHNIDPTSSPNSPSILDDTSGHLLSSDRGTDDDDTADNDSDDDDSDGIPSVRTGT